MKYSYVQVYKYILPSLKTVLKILSTIFRTRAILGVIWNFQTDSLSSFAYLQHYPNEN